MGLQSNVSLTKTYTGTQFGTSVENYDQGRRPYPESVINWVKEKINGNEKHVLDIACGTGRLTFPIFEKVTKNITGLDIDARMIEYAKSIAKGDKYEGKISFVQSDVKNIAQTLPEKKFDVITAAESIHWMLTSDDLNAVKSALKPDGLLLVVGGRFAAKPINTEDQSKKEQYDVHHILNGVIPAEKRGSREEVDTKAELEKHGFEIEEKVFQYDESRNLEEAIKEVKSYSTYTELDEETQKGVEEDLSKKVINEFQKFCKDGIVTTQKNLTCLVCKVKKLEIPAEAKSVAANPATSYVAQKGGPVEVQNTTNSVLPKIVFTIQDIDFNANVILLNGHTFKAVGVIPSNWSRGDQIFMWTNSHNTQEVFINHTRGNESRFYVNFATQAVPGTATHLIKKEIVQQGVIGHIQMGKNCNFIYCFGRSYIIPPHVNRIFSGNIQAFLHVGDPVRLTTNSDGSHTLYHVPTRTSFIV